MTDHNAPTGGLTHVGGLNRFGDCADLVYLQEESITKFLINTSLNTLGVCHQKIVTDNLDTLVKLLGHFDVGCKIVLVKGVLNGDNGVVGGEIVVDSEELVRGDDAVI